MERTPSETPDITLYTTDPCARCHRSKALLEEHGLPYQEVNLAKDPVGRKELVALTGRMTFPQIVIDGRPLGGEDELIEAARNGELEKLGSA
jgi:glutaredoxin 3